MKTSLLGRAATGPKQYRGKARIAPQRSQSAASLKLPPVLDDSKLRPGFTAFSNAIFATAIRFKTLAEYRLLLYIARFTSGFCREWHKLHLASALEACDLKKSAIHKAKASLQASGIIELRADRYGQAWVRLTEAFQPFERDYLDTRRNPFASVDDESTDADLESTETDTESASADSKEVEKCAENTDANEVSGACPSVPKETRERHEVKRQQQTPPTEAEAAPAASVPAVFSHQDGEQDQRFDREAAPPSAQVAEPVAPAQQPRAITAPAEPKGPLTPSQQHSLDTLRGHGVGAPMDLHLARSKAPEIIRRALADLASVQDRRGVSNVPGWLVSGLSSGRYDVAQPTRPSQPSGRNEVERQSTVNPRQRAAALEAQRRREAEAEQADRGRLNAETAQRVRTLDDLSSAERAELRAKAIKRLGTDHMPEAAILGMMLGLFEDRQRMMQELQRRAG